MKYSFKDYLSSCFLVFLIIGIFIYNKSKPVSEVSIQLRAQVVTIQRTRFAQWILIKSLDEKYPHNFRIDTDDLFENKIGFALDSILDIEGTGTIREFSDTNKKLELIKTIKINGVTVPEGAIEIKPVL